MCLWTQALSSIFCWKNTLFFFSLRHNKSSTIIFFNKLLLIWINYMNSVFWNILVVVWIEIITMHFNLTSNIQCLQSWGNHINLLINFYFFNCLLIIKNVFILCKRILNWNFVQISFLHFNQFVIWFIYQWLFYWNEIFNELFLSISFNLFNILYLNLENTVILKLITTIFFIEKI